jgi:hypothetical protein
VALTPSTRGKGLPGGCPDSRRRLCTPTCRIPADYPRCLRVRQSNVENLALGLGANQIVLLAITVAERGGNDPPHVVETATAGQGLCGADDGTDDQARDERGTQAVDAAGDGGTGKAGDREGDESGSPGEPWSQECRPGRQGGVHGVQLLVPDSADSVVVAGLPRRRGRSSRTAKATSQTLHRT